MADAYGYSSPVMAADADDDSSPAKSGLVRAPLLYYWIFFWVLKAIREFQA
jgi:hypothetical protein